MKKLILLLALAASFNASALTCRSDSFGTTRCDDGTTYHTVLLSRHGADAFYFGLTQAVLLLRVRLAVLCPRVIRFSSLHVLVADDLPVLSLAANHDNKFIVSVSGAGNKQTIRCGRGQFAFSWHN